MAFLCNFREFHLNPLIIINNLQTMPRSRSRTMSPHPCTQTLLVDWPRAPTAHLRRPRLHAERKDVWLHDHVGKEDGGGREEERKGEEKREGKGEGKG